MTKAEINLLPPATKRERLTRLLGRRVSRLYWWVVLVVGVVAIALGGALGVLQQMNHQLQGVAAGVQRQADGVKTIRSLNQLFRAVQSRTTNSFAWGPAVAAVLAVVPPDVRLTQLEVTFGESSLVIEGTSTNRAAVAAFEQHLQGLNWVGKVEAPLTNLVLVGDGAFSFTVQRKMPSL